MNFLARELRVCIKMTKRYPEAIQHYPESMQIIVKRVVHRIDNGKNALIPVVGQTGSGKSTSMVGHFHKAIYLYMHGEEPTDDYLISHVFFKAKPFMETMSKMSDDLENKEKVETQVWIWDEAGIEAGHKEFMSVRNKILGWLVQTFRNLKQIVIFTTPSLSFIDASIRKMLHFYFEVVAVDKSRQLCIIKPLIMQYNTRMDKIYYHNFTYPDRRGYIMEVDVMAVPRIPPKLEEKYEWEKNKFTAQLNREILATLTKIDRKDEAPYLKLTDRQKKIVELLNQGVTDKKKIAEIVGVHVRSVYENIKWIENKGFPLKKQGFEVMEVTVPPA